MFLRELVCCRSDESVEEEKIESLALYLRAQRTKLERLQLEEVTRLEFDWDVPEDFLPGGKGRTRKDLRKLQSQNRQKTARP